MATRTAGIIIGCALAAAGCANQTSIWRNEHAAGHVLAMDAQQRVVLSAHRVVPVTLGQRTTTTVTGTTTAVTGTTTTVTGSGTRTVVEPQVERVQRVYYCPEPSPDAIASFASAFGLGGSKSTGTESLDLKAGSALATAVAAVGLRTPTTQVIRDLLTAACIADMNGSFENPEFREAFARNQQFVLAAHAIAVIGGEPVAGLSGVGGSSSLAAADLVQTYNNFKTAQAARQQAEAAEQLAAGDHAAAAARLEKAESDLAASPADTGRQQAADKARKELDAAGAVLAGAQKRMADARALEASASSAAAAASTATSAAANGTAAPGTIVMSRVEKLTDKAVEQIGLITTGVMAQAFTLDKCISHLREIMQAQPALPEPQLAELRSAVAGLCTQQVKTQESIQLRTQQLMAR